MYIINNSGPSIEFCGTPHKIDFNVEVSPLTLQHCLQLDKYDSKNLSSSLYRPYLFNFFSKIS